VQLTARDADVFVLGRRGFETAVKGTNGTGLVLLEKPNHHPFLGSCGYGFEAKPR
jgi:hypothetical protein